MGKIRSTNQVEPPPAFEVPAEADALLTNWGRWAAPRHGCKRALNPNFRYVRPDRWASADDHTSAPAVYSSPPDADQAWTVEKIVCNPNFWPPARLLLTEHYVLRRNPRSICAALCIPRTGYEHELWRAACMLWNAYEKAKQSTCKA
jgi:hypothetical protein